MGANVSSQSTSLINKVKSDQSTKISNSSEYSTSSTLNSAQKMDVEINIKGTSTCGYQFRQDMKVVSKVYSKIDSKKQADLQNTILETIKNEATNIVDQKVSGISLGSANVSKIKQNVENYSFYDLSNEISSFITNAVNSEIDANQDQKIRINIDGDLLCDKDTQMIVSQNIDIDQILDNMVKDKNIVKSDNDFTKFVDNEIAAVSDQSVVGLSFDMIILIVVIAIAIAIGFGFFLARKWGII